MITVRNAKILSDKVLYDVFKEAFSDYMIKFSFDQENFINHMFGVEGNKREYSFVAYEDYKPAGIILGGLNPTMAIKTLRCGGMGVIKELRGSGIAIRLIDEHIKLAKSLGCVRAYLEVIKGNDRAISFYQKNAYKQVYHLNYKTLELDTDIGEEVYNKLMENQEVLEPIYSINEISFEEVEKLREIDHTYLPWQGSFKYFEELDFKYYGVKAHGELVAAIGAGSNRLAYIYVVPKHRNKGLAKNLLRKVIEDLQPLSLRMTYANNDLLEFFTSRYGFKEDGLSQYEMYHSIEE